MAAKPLPDQALLLKLLRYESDTGKLFWRERTPDMFAGAPHAGHQAQAFNRTFAGQEAFRSLDDCGYKQGWVIGRKARAHRIIWKMQTGWEPEQIDHINGIPSDNRWENLVASDAFRNMRNLPRSRRNTSGRTGVEWHVRAGKWRAQIRVMNNRIHLGLFTHFSDAVAAREVAENLYGFHANHDRNSPSIRKRSHKTNIEETT